MDFKGKLMMIYLCKKDYKLLGEWKLYEHNLFLDKDKKRKMLDEGAGEATTADE